jgi:hypothetical protein
LSLSYRRRPTLNWYLNPDPEKNPAFGAIEI